MMGIKKGMLLAAGLGTRLLPVTKKIPKPLVPVLNVPNIVHNIFLFKRLGIEEIILNSHYLAEPLENFLGDGKKWGVSLSYSREKVLLGTGGGVKKAESFFGKETFALANCDFICNFDLQPFLKWHQSKNALATMVLFEDAKRQSLYSPVGVTKEGRLCSLPKFTSEKPARTGIFTGIHFLEPSVLKYLKEEPSGINDVLYPKLMKEFPEKVLGAFSESGYWYDTGDIPAICESTFQLLKELGSDAELKKLVNLKEQSNGVWVGKGSEIPRDCKLIAPVLIGDNCRIGKGVSLGPNVCLSNGTQVNDGVSLSSVVALENSRFANSLNEPALQYEENPLLVSRTKKA